jgi:hypothetical protein
MLSKLVHRELVVKGNDKRSVIDGIPPLADSGRHHPIDAGFRRACVAPKIR